MSPKKIRLFVIAPSYCLKNKKAAESHTQFLFFFNTHTHTHTHTHTCNADTYQHTNQNHCAQHRSLKNLNQKQGVHLFNNQNKPSTKKRQEKHTYQKTQK